MRKIATAITAPMTSRRHDQAPARRTPRGSDSATGSAGSVRAARSRRRFRKRALAGGTDGFCAAGASLSAMPASLGALCGGS
jgi:hypothetical protein